MILFIFFLIHIMTWCWVLVHVMCSIAFFLRLRACWHALYVMMKSPVAFHFPGSTRVEMRKSNSWTSRVYHHPLISRNTVWSIGVTSAAAFTCFCR
jgi:hypothetical protein